jgi:phage terminase small subunit
MEIKPKTKENDYRPLTPQQERFCREYLRDRNGTQAAIRAKYSPRTSNEQAARLLAKVSVKVKINQLIEAQFNRLKLSADLVVKELLKSALVDIRDAFTEDGNLKPINELSEPLAKAIASIETEELFDGRGEDKERIGYAKKIRFHDKIRALELLGKHLKMFTDVHEIPGLDTLAERLEAAEKRARACKPQKP